MRKYIRAIMMYKASKQGGKTRRIFSQMWEKYMYNIYGRHLVSLFWDIGTGKSQDARRKASRVLRYPRATYYYMGW